MKVVEITTTEYAECYAMVDKEIFKIGLISDLTSIPGGGRTYCKPFVEFKCNENEDPEKLFHSWARQLEKPKEPFQTAYIGMPGDCICYVATCPTCNEVTYGHPSCPFCGQLFKEA